MIWQNILSFHQYPWIKALAELPGTEVTWIVERETTSDVQALGWPVLKDGRFEVVVGPSLEQVRNLCRGMGEGDVHLLSGPRGYPLSLMALREARRSRSLIGCIVENRDMGDMRQPLREVVYRVDRVLYGGRLDFLLIQGFLDPHGGMSWFRRVGYPGVKLFPFGYLTPLPLQNVPLREGHQTPRIVFLGNLIRRKGVDILLDALALLPEVPWELVILGGGPKQAELEVLTTRLGLNGRVTFRGTTRNAEAMEVVASSDLLVLPSRQDGWGAVVNEALARGVPVICSDRTGAKDLLQESWRGQVFRSEDTVDLGAKLRQQLETGPVQAELRTRISSWAQSHLSGESLAQYLLDVIDDVQAGRRDSVIAWHSGEPTNLSGSAFA